MRNGTGSRRPLLPGVRHGAPAGDVPELRGPERRRKVLRAVRNIADAGGPIATAPDRARIRATALERVVRRPRRLHGAVGGPRSGGGPRAPVAVFRPGADGGRPLRRDGREVHRGRRDGRVGRSGRAGGRRRAGGARRSGAGDRRCGARRRGRGTGAAAPRRDHHGGSGGDGRCHERGHGRRGHRQHGGAHPGERRAGGRVGRRADARPHGRGGRVRRRGTPRAQGQGRTAHAVRGPIRRGRCRRRTARGRSRAPVRGPRPPATTRQGALPRDDRRGPAATRPRVRAARGRQEPGRVGVREVHRRAQRGLRVAPRHVPRLRRRRRLPGTERDRAAAAGHRRR